MPWPDPPAIRIGGRRVAADVPPFVLAEIGLNHDGSLDRALALVDAAAASGAHGVKLQVLEAGALVAPACPAPMHVSASSLVDFFRRFELDADALRAVVARAQAIGLAVVATALAESLVDPLDAMGIDAFKIASGDLTYDQLIARCARTGRPLVISTGMASLDEVRHAVGVARRAGAAETAVLHCVSAYPVPPGSENLLALRTLADALEVPVGLSDHGADAQTWPLAVALGATLYERHLALWGDTDAEAIDRAVSSTPDELADAIAAGGRAWLALGTGRKICLPAESGNREPSRRAWCAARDLPAGRTLTAGDLVALRPATGVAPRDLACLVGRRLIRGVAAGEPVPAAAVEAPDPGRDVSRVA